MLLFCDYSSPMVELQDCDCFTLLFTLFNLILLILIHINLRDIQPMLLCRLFLLILHVKKYIKKLQFHENYLRDLT